MPLAALGAPSPSSLQQQVKGSLGARYAEAQRLSAQKKHRAAIALLEGMLDEAEDGPAAVPIRRLLSRLYLLTKQEQKARAVLRVATGPASRPLARSYAKRFLQLRDIVITFTLSQKKGKSQSTQKRRMHFVYNRKNRLERKWGMKGPSASSIQATLKVRPTSGLVVEGVLRYAGKTKHFRLPPISHEPHKVTLTLSYRIDDLGMKIHCQVSPTVKLGKWKPWAKSSSKRRYDVSFKKVKLRSMIQKLAALNHLKITFKGKAPAFERRISLKIRAKMKRDLLFLSCRHADLHCTIQGEHLIIERASDATAPSRKTPTPPRTPVPPRVR